MNSKQIAGIVIALIGVVMLFASNYISGQVSAGWSKIHRAQGQVDTANKVFGITPVTKQIGEGITDSAQNKINEGRDEATYYGQMAHTLMIGGVIALVVGVALFVFCRRKK